MERVTFLLWLALFFTCGIGISAQSGRVSPGTSESKTNKRPPSVKPTPTPTPISEDDQAKTDQGVAVPDDGDIVNVDTQLVTIPVRVLDRRNRFVSGLDKSSFKIFEDNVEQSVEYFTNEEQPFTVALVLDMSYSTKFKIAEIQSAAISFIDQLRPNDSVLVVSFDEEVHLLCDVTNDRQKIYRAIKGTRVTTGTSLYEAVDMVINDRLRRIKGRKAVILFTDGVDTTSRRVNPSRNLNDATEVDALIYPIRYDTFADVQAMKDRPIISAPPQTSPIPGTTPTNFPLPFPLPSIGTPGGAGTTEEDYRKAEEYLDQLALRTGGRVYFASSYGNLTDAFNGIAAELREYYSLGYYPKEEGKPGTDRRIKVKVDRPGSVVKARDRYIIARKKPLASK